MPKYPDFLEDPNVLKTQEFLRPYGEDILRGDVPDYFKPIGDIGGREFEDILGLTKRDITRAGFEAGARTGTRGPRLAFGIEQAIGDVSKKARFEDLMRGIEGRKFLFGQGRGITEGVRGAGLEFGRQKNVFGLDIAKLQQQERQFQQQREDAEKQANANRWAEILKSGIGAAGSVAGAYLGGPFGAAAGRGIANFLTRGPRQQIGSQTGFRL